MATVQQLVTALIDKIYPVGVIIGFTQDIDPNKQIGGLEADKGLLPVRLGG